MSCRKKQSAKRILYVAFVIYMVILIYFLLFSEGFGRTSHNESYRYNLVLFQEIKRFITYYHILGMKSVLVNVVGNIVAFMPFGFFMPFIGKKRRGFINVTLLSIELSLFIETVQLITKVGSYDVDDLLLNSLGGVLGYVVYAICNQIVKRRAKSGISEEER